MAFNLLWVFIQPLSWVNRLSVYNVLVPGRERFAFGEYSAESYSLIVNSLDQLFASHVIAPPKPRDEFRVVLIGDSAVWGYLLPPQATQSACINRLRLAAPNGKTVRAYNLGYPKLTVIKDLLILQRALAHQPDLILWQTTLASLYPSDQLDFALITSHRAELDALQAQYRFKLDQYPLPEADFWSQTFFGQRRDVADWLRHQLYGIGWALTGRDHVIPRLLRPHPTNLLPDDSLLSVNVVRLQAERTITADDLNFDVLRVGIGMAQAVNVPLVLINEPIYRKVDDPLRYNSYYPRWAYDGYREVFAQLAAAEQWRYLDLWDAVPPDQFTDTDFHLTAEANCAYAEQMITAALSKLE
ncbi:MAG: hypothetical protein OHK0023_01070 [Anaerolineae bacterium]